MPVIRFVREGRDIECYPGENLREVALREGIQLYGLKGALGNCGGCGQCITCFVAIPEGTGAQVLSGRPAVEDQKLRRRPQTWRLACQTMVQESVLVLTRPQVGMADQENLVAEAQAKPLPSGPTAWPAPPVQEGEEDLEDGGEGQSQGDEQAPTATSGEAS
jgi:ferredoxin